MLAASKLGKLENVQIFEVIQSYFKDLNRNNRDYEDYHGDKKSRTQEAYEADARFFLRVVRGKIEGNELEYLNFNEIQFTLEDLETFKEYMFDAKKEDGKNKYTNKTINRKVSGVKSFIRYLAKKKLIKDVSFLELVESEKQKDNHYGVLDVKECFEMSEWCRNTEREKSEIKRLLVLFSLDTCIRKSAVLKLKWSDFTVREEGVMVKAIDKGNSEFRQLISKEFYEQLLTIKTDSDRVFDISGDAIDSMMKRFREFYNIPEERRIVWHSIRKSGITFRYRVTSDILEAKRAANHKNIQTTMIYLANEDYGAMGAVSSAGKVDHELYKKVSHEELVKAIDLMKNDAKFILNMKLMELIKKGN